MYQQISLLVNHHTIDYILISKLLQGIKNRKKEIRKKYLNELKNLIIIYVQDLPREIFTKFLDDISYYISNLLQSSISFEQMAGLEMLNKLIFISCDEEEEKKVIRFANYLRNFFSKASSCSNETLQLAAKALGNLAKSNTTPGTISAAFVDFEAKRALEWLQDYDQYTNTNIIDDTTNPIHVNNNNNINNNNNFHIHIPSKKKLASCYILKELAESAPTLFHVNVPIFFDHIWTAIRNIKLEIREAATKAFSSCLILIAQRQTRHRVQWYCKIYEQVRKGLYFNNNNNNNLCNTNTTNTISNNNNSNNNHTSYFLFGRLRANNKQDEYYGSMHGSLLIIGELLIHTGDFMVPRYKEICDIILKYKEIKDKLIKITVCSLLAKLAFYCPDLFVQHYLDISILHLIKTTHSFHSSSSSSSTSSSSSLSLSLSLSLSFDTTNNNTNYNKNHLNTNDDKYINDNYNTCGPVFLALGEMALAVKDNILPYIKPIISLIKDKMIPIKHKGKEIPIKMNYNDKIINDINFDFNSNIKYTNYYFCVESLTCIANLAKAVKQDLIPYMDENLLNKMMSSRLNEPLIHALAEIANNIPEYLVKIQEKLLHQLSYILQNSPFSETLYVQDNYDSDTDSEKSFDTISENYKFDNHITEEKYQQNKINNSIINEKKDISLVLLALKTLTWFDFSGTFCLLPFIKNCVLLYLQYENVHIRQEAAIVCTKLLLPLEKLIPYPIKISNDLNTNEVIVPATSCFSRSYIDTGNSFSFFRTGASSFIISDILDNMLKVAISDPSSNVRKTIISCLNDNKFTDFMSQADKINPIFLIINDENTEIRKIGIELLGKLNKKNPAYIVSFFRNLIIQFIKQLQLTENLNNKKEENIHLLTYIIKNTSSTQVIQPYVSPILQTIIPSLYDKTSKHLILSKAVLEMIGELAVICGNEMIQYERFLLPHIVYTFSNRNSVNEKATSLKTLGKLVSNTGSVVYPYTSFPKLLDSLLNIFSHNNSNIISPWTLRKQAMKTIGILGAFDKYKYNNEYHIDQKRNYNSIEKPFLVDIHNTNDTYGDNRQDLFSLFNNFNDENEEKDPNEMEQMNDNENNIKNTLNIEDYYSKIAIKSLMKIITKSSLIIHHVNVIQAIMIIFKSLGNKSVIQFLPIIMPSFINILRNNKNNNDMTHRESFLFQQLAVLVSIVKKYLKPYLSDIFQLVCEHWERINIYNNSNISSPIPRTDNITSREYSNKQIIMDRTNQKNIETSGILTNNYNDYCDILEQIFYLLEEISLVCKDEFKIFLPTLIPFFLQTLQLSKGNNKNNTNNEDKESMLVSISSNKNMSNYTLDNKNDKSIETNFSSIAVNKENIIDSNYNMSNSSTSENIKHSKTDNVNSFFQSFTNPSRNCKIQIQLIRSFMLFGDVLNDYLYLLMPSLVHLLQSNSNDSSTLSLKLVILEALGKICQNTEFSRNACMIVHPLAFLLGMIENNMVLFKNENNSTTNNVPLLIVILELVQNLLFTLCAVVHQLQKDYLLYEHMISKKLEKVNKWVDEIQFSRFYENTNFNKNLLIDDKKHPIQSSSNICIMLKNNIQRYRDTYLLFVNQLNKNKNNNYNYIITKNMMDTVPPLIIPSSFSEGMVPSSSHIQRTSTYRSLAFMNANSNLVGDNESNTSNNEQNHSVRLHVNQQNLRRAWESSQRSTNDDWLEWLRRFSIELLRESPSPSLRSCASLAQIYYPLTIELFNVSFHSCWSELYDQYQEYLIQSLETAFQSDTIPAEILQTLLHLAEFMERDVEEALPIDIRQLGELATKCNAYAKALHYKELEFQTSPQTCIEDLIEINNQLLQHEAALGALKYAQEEDSQIIVKESWFEKLNDWKQALELYNKKLLLNKHDINSILGKMRCLEALHEWEDLYLLVNDMWRQINTYSYISPRSSFFPNHVHTNPNELEEKPMVRKQIAMLGAKASWSLGKWDDMEKYVSYNIKNNSYKTTRFINNNSIQDIKSKTFDSFYQSILSIHSNNFTDAKYNINKTRQILDTKLTSLSNESTSSSQSYKPMIILQQLVELEEIIRYKKIILLNNEVSNEVNNLNSTKNNNKASMYRNHLMNIWKKRLILGCKRNLNVWQEILNVRSLILSPLDDIDIWLQYATLCRQSDNLSLSLKILKNSLYSDKCLENVIYKKNNKISNENNIEIHKSDQQRIVFTYIKHLWAVGKRKESLKKVSILLDSLHEFNDSILDINNNNNNNNNTLLVKCHLKYGEWQLAMYDQDLQYINIKNILSTFRTATELDKYSYKAWHSWALMNFQAIEHYSNFHDSKRMYNKDSNHINIIPFIASAVSGFFHSIRLGKTRWLANVQQDILRLLTLWFSYGHIIEVNNELVKGFHIIPIETWLIVIPQLIARIHTPISNIRLQLHDLLSRIGESHPQALIYPLSVALKSPLNIRKEAAELIMTRMKNNNHLLVEQALLVSKELIRIAILWHEMWHEGLEEASRLYFGDKNINGMINTLEPLHLMMEKGPETLREVSFYQAFGKDLQEAYEWIRRYRIKVNHTIHKNNTKHEWPELNHAWDLYYHVFRRINKQLPQLTVLELQYVSPLLFNSNHLQLAIPGTYRVNAPIIKIKSFLAMIHVITSKQRPRKITITGTNNKNYSFLLKGHEDLRQDERVMQLFGLVNALLINDREKLMYLSSNNNTSELRIQRYSVIPLSHNAGIVGWVPHCDTLHQLIRDYREKRKILLNIEHRLMLQMAPDYDSLTLLQKVEVFNYALENTAGQDLYKVLWLKSPNSEIWLNRRNNYTKSLAVMSMVGYILGLGDRHPSNLMLDRYTGFVVHIDFGDCFEVAMERDKYPEKIPFRLTRMLINAMEITGIKKGNYIYSCERVMKILRVNRSSLMAMLEAFVHDPLICWRLLTPIRNGDSPESSLSRLKENDNDEKFTPEVESSQNVPNESTCLNLSSSKENLHDTVCNKTSDIIIKTNDMDDVILLKKKEIDLIAADNEVTCNDGTIHINDNNDNKQLNKVHLYSHSLPMKIPTEHTSKKNKSINNRNEVNIKDKDKNNLHLEISTLAASITNDGNTNLYYSIISNNHTQKLKDPIATSEPKELKLRDTNNTSFMINNDKDIIQENTIQTNTKENKLNDHLEEKDTINITNSYIKLNKSRSHREKELVDKLGPEGSGAPLEALNEKAINVIKRVQAKLTGKDFNIHNTNDNENYLQVPEQVEQLVSQATSHENLCQCYIGWCPFW